MITLPALRRWKPDDMDNTATHFTQLAANRTDTMNQIAAVDMPWVGAGAAGKDAALAGHTATASAHAAAFGVTAAVAKTGGQALYGMQQTLLKAVDTATNSGFKVGDDWTVTDTAQDPWTRAARQGIAAGMQAVLRTQATAFDAQRAATAAGIRSSIQAVDYTVNPDGTVKYTPNVLPPAVITQGDPPPDPGKHYCGPLEIAQDTTVGTAGAYGLSGAGGPGGILPGLGAWLKAIQDLSKCANPHG